MKTYRRLKDFSTWHWHNSCSSWPSHNFNEQVMTEHPGTDNGRLCRECCKWDELEMKQRQQKEEKKPEADRNMRDSLA